MMISNKTNIRIGLCGASGRMGQTVIQRIDALGSNYSIVSKFNRSNPLSDLREFCKNSDVIIDFSSPDILEALVEKAIEYNTKLVIGTTNLQETHINSLNNASNYIPIIYSANMSIGANLMLMISTKMAKILGNNYDIEILDKHHRHKKDSPSGTSITLGKALANARNIVFEESVIFDRHNKGQRLPNEIGISSIRGGGIYGEHDVFFISDDEIISINHQSLNRHTFADGAIAAASWIVDKKPGLYSILDSLNHET
jgi:4-hydroxy-tetrahydrodipicolinate reductase